MRRSENKPNKGRSYQNLPIPTNITQVRSFHSLASFYRRFVKNFSTIMSPITDCTKGNNFKWTEEAQQAFECIKEAMCILPILRLSDFSKPFEVECDASNTDIGAALIQEGRPIAYFSEKLNKRRVNYSTYDKEFYAMAKALEHCHIILKDSLLSYTQTISHLNTFVDRVNLVPNMLGGLSLCKA